ncbi:MAG: type II secretion system F family protein [Sedimentibacter sp.]
MSIFKCKVVSSTGNMQVFKLDGFSKEDIIENLKKDNFIIIDVKSVEHTMNKINLTLKDSKLKSKELSLFCKQMNTMLKSGITILKCIEILSSQTENIKLRSVLNKMYKELLTGSKFSEAVYTHKDSFPALFVIMVQAGELSGNIETVMDRVASHYTKEYKIESNVKLAFAYPIILSIVATAVVIFLLVNVMPTFVDIYESYGVPMPFMTLLLLNMSRWLKNMWLVILLFVILAVISVKRLRKNFDVRYKMDSLRLRMPLYGILKVKLAASRFTRTLSTLLGSGVSLLEALETVSTIAGNEYIAKHIMNAREDVKSGSSLAFSILNQNIFPPIVYLMIRLGEESGQVEEVLDKTADFFDDEVENAMQKLITMIEPILIVIMAVIVGFIMLAMITPMFDMVNMVQ